MEKNPVDEIQFRPTLPEDSLKLPAIEHSAAQAFLTLADFAWLAQESGIGSEQHQHYIAQNNSWVAVAGNQPVGFILAETLEDSLFIVELSVANEWQNQGIGRRLLALTASAAEQRGLSALMLTTFRTVPWNAPFYQRNGFRMLEDAQLTPGLWQKLESEAAHGLRLETRCAMRRELNPTLPDALRLSGLPPTTIVE
ncbi:N-acetyltransferase [Enterobacteriaceae bacterium 89]|nr:N-acetyltransferase [Enterobacteriaceae bacterium 89]